MDASEFQILIEDEAGYVITCSSNKYEKGRCTRSYSHSKDREDWKAKGVERKQESNA